MATKQKDSFRFTDIFQANKSEFVHKMFWEYF